MTYVRKRNLVRVVFEEPHFLAGLSIQTESVSVREIAEFGLKLAEASQVEKAGTDVEKLRGLGGLLDSLDEVRAMFAEKLLEWDMVEEDGEPTPATLVGVKRLDDKEFYGIVGEWLAAFGELDENTGKGSGSGETSPELSDLMEPLSPSQAS